MFDFGLLILCGFVNILLVQMYGKGPTTHYRKMKTHQKYILRHQKASDVLLGLFMSLQYLVGPY